MTTILEATATYIGAQISGLTLGTNVFMSKRPDIPDRCVTVYESPGYQPVETMRDGGSSVDRPGLQVVCRGEAGDYATPRDDAEDIRNLLQAVVGQSLSGVAVLRIAAAGSLISMGDDNKDRPLVSVNFDVWVEHS